MAWRSAAEQPIGVTGWRHLVIPLVVLALVAMACTNGGDGPGPAESPEPTNGPEGGIGVDPPEGDEDPTGWRTGVVVEIDGELTWLGHGAMRLTPEEVSVDMSFGADGAAPRLVAGERGTFLGVEEEAGGTTWIDFTDPVMLLPDDAHVFEPDEELSQEPVRTEQLDGVDLDVHAGFAGAVASDADLAVATVEVWVDEHGEPRRHMFVVSALPAGGGEPVRIMVVADRDDDVSVRAPRVRRGATVPAAAALRTIDSPALTSNAEAFREPRSVGVSSPLSGSGVLPVARPAIAQPASAQAVDTPEGCTVIDRERGILQCDGRGEVSNDDRQDVGEVPTVEDAPSGLSLGDLMDNSLMAGVTIIGGLFGGASIFTSAAAAVKAGGFIGIAGGLLGVAIGSVVVGAFAGVLGVWLLASIKGEPHLVTLDGTRYSFQATGEFVFLDSPVFAVQTRFEGRKGRATWTQATAVRVGNTVVEVPYERLEQPDVPGVEVVIDGSSTVVDYEGVALPGGGHVMRRSGGDFGGVHDGNVLVVSPRGDYVIVENLNISQNLRFGVTVGTAETVVGGLGGVPDGDRTTDFTLRDGTVLSALERGTIEGLYGRFAGSWRVRPEERLFTDGSAEEYLTDEHTSLPESVFSLSDFSTEELAAAREQCVDAGVPAGEAVDRCAYDVLATGDDGWVEQAAASEVVQGLAGDVPSLRSDPGAERVGDHPLIVAADRCRLDDVTAELDAGASPNLRDDDGWSPLLFVAQRDCVEVVDRLLSAGADPTAVNDARFAPLYLAAQNGREQAVSRLLEAGASPLRALPGGDTPLLVAAFRGHEQVARLLIDAGSPLDVPRDDGFTPLLAAVQEGHADIVALLLSAGADPNRATDRGRTALMRAASDRAVELASQLLETGADPNATDRRGITALHLAADRDAPEVLELLLEPIANVDVQDDRGRTPLHFAASEDAPEVVELLLDAGANPNIEDNRDRTPQDYAGPTTQPLLEQ